MMVSASSRYVGTEGNEFEFIFAEIILGIFLFTQSLIFLMQNAAQSRPKPYS